MRLTRYIPVLLLIAILQLLLGWPFSYTPELLYIIAFCCALNIPRRQVLPTFFIAGIISDFFIGQHLGTNTFLYCSSGLLVIYWRKNLPSSQDRTQLLLLTLCLAYIFTIRFLLAHFSFQFSYSLNMLFNNFLFSLLLAPGISLILELSLIRPWKKSYS